MLIQLLEKRPYDVGYLVRLRGETSWSLALMHGYRAASLLEPLWANFACKSEAKLLDSLLALLVLSFAYASELKRLLPLLGEARCFIT